MSAHVQNFDCMTPFLVETVGSIRWNEASTEPNAHLVELEFMAIFDEEGVEEGKESLRLLRHHAWSVQHQKYYGLDVVTVQVKLSPGA